MILQKEFYERETVIVAKQLLGKTLTRKIRGRKLTGIITETEAYRGNDDPASHAAVKMTPRNKVMFGQVGVSYVYFTYGMYFMLNVVAKSKKQNAGAILIRGMYPQNGIEIMKKNRGVNETQNISNGPGKLTIALGITMKHHNKDLTDNSELYISDGIKPKKINQKSRIGISKGIEKQWNFSINIKDYFSSSSSSNVQGTNRPKTRLQSNRSKISTTAVIPAPNPIIPINIGVGSCISSTEYMPKLSKIGSITGPLT